MPMYGVKVAQNQEDINWGINGRERKVKRESRSFPVGVGGTMSALEEEHCVLAQSKSLAILYGA